jgi:hypothetical protein
LKRKDSLPVRIYEWFHARMPTIIDCRPIDADRMIQAVGFEIEGTMEKSIWGLPVQIIIARKYG